ncbi:MAG: DNA mismatch repair protein MutS, partial [Sedimentisphaerales bacterium]|nr:DNA mismatch repair protein MutS [Sedimentisphaerales bacterium]
MQNIDISKLTPAMQQYVGFKRQYPEAILLFRMGDFYETFYDDARTCAQVLGITLTCRNKNSDNPVPLAGLPYHAIDSYLPRLIKAGYKVAVCEQVEDPATAKGVVKRDVVRLITPGTLTEDNLLGGAAENYLAAICFESQGSGKSSSNMVGIAWVDLSTGQFFAQMTEIRFLIDELVRISPSECLITQEREDLPPDFARQLAEVIGTVVTTRPGWSFDARQGYEELTGILRAGSLEGFGFTEPDCSIASAGVIIDYLKETQKIALDHITSLRKIKRESFLQLDQVTLRSLEIERTIREGHTVGSLLGSIDETRSAMGTRKLRHWICYPLNNLDEIQRRQGAVAELTGFDNVRDNLRSVLREVTDIERIATRISTGRAVPRDLLGLAQALRQLPVLKEVLSGCTSELLAELSGQCDNFETLTALIESAISPEAGMSIRDGNIINTGYDPEVDRLRGLCHDGQTWLVNYQKKLIEQTGLTNLKVGYNKVFGYYVELSQAQAEKAPVHFVRKQTLKNAERYITDELKQYETEALTAEQRSKELEERLFHEVRREVATYTLRLQQAAETVAEIDVLASFAYIARTRNYCQPEVHAGHDLEIKEGRHPVLDVQLGGKFVPNDVALGGRFGDVGIITGPNMSGKSTYIRQTALLVLLAHTGSFIPA